MRVRSSLIIVFYYSISVSIYPISGYKSYGESCLPSVFSTSQERDSCDPRRSLICERRYNRCDCLENMVWSYNYERCSYKIGFPCTLAANIYGEKSGNYYPGTQLGLGGTGGIYGGTSQFGSQSYGSQSYGSNYRNYGECPPNGYCDTLTRMCVCTPYYYPNHDGSYCNGSYSFVGDQKWTKLIILFISAIVFSNKFTILN